ncbi:hypothetical protein [Yeosuana marina]|uniref:hypothetical protein n=1 Tax=Yeosuana marina TaxID=1565536 RepID=UPI0030ECA7D4|tara:strand:- start:901 stop:1869 length:969 start_codon:yes stop_codon:yes gene_type:complete
MKTQPHLFPFKNILLPLLIISFTATLYSCKFDKKERKPEEPKIENEQVINILTENMDFQMADTIPSGWNTFRYKNASTQTHFFLIDKYPEGITLDSVKARVLPPFDKGMKLINEGNAEEGFAQFGKLPAWFMEMKNYGGSGLISPGLVTETTVKLNPGYYIIECYVKMSNGVWHTSMGMATEVIVSETNSGNIEPKADIAITISSTEGIVFNDSISKGPHTFSVFYKDQIAHENFIGHDVNLAKLGDNADLDEINNWMDWSKPKGLIEPAPKGITFLGGVNNMIAGDTGYFTVNLEPGRYILISEVPNPASKNMLKTFIVSE